MNKRAWLPSLSVNRPVTVIMVLSAILVVGIIAYSKIKLELFPPGYTPPFLQVYVPYRNANPQEIEEQITRPVEEILQTVRNMSEISSQSGTDGARIWLEFSQKANMDMAYNQVRDRIERVRPELPNDIERIFVRKFNDDDDPILFFGISLDKEFQDPYYLVDVFVKRSLERIDGVANVDIFGTTEKMILIDLDQDKIRSLKIDIYPLIQNLQNDNFAMPSGYLSEGRKKIYIRSLGKFSSLEEIENIQVRGSDILLKDIAEIRYDIPEVRWVQRLDGKQAIKVGVFKESMANTVDLSNLLLKKLDEEIIPNKALEGMTFTVFFDQGSFIRESMDNLQKAGLWGGIFAFFILLFFLRRARITILITLAIPLSLVITISTMYFIGWSLNLMTLMGMMICVGLVIDNSIVIVENIYRRRNLGDPPSEAAISGASEVSLAVTMATLTTVVVFLPLILLSDDGGFAFYMLRIGLPVISALLGSLLVALVFIPLIANKLPTKGKVTDPKIIAKSRNIYERLLNWSLGHRFDTVLIGLVILISMQVPASLMKKMDNASGNIGDFRIIAEMPDSYTMEDSDRFIRAVETYLEEHRETHFIRTIDARYTRNWGMVQTYVEPMENNSWWYVTYRNIRKGLGYPVDSRIPLDEISEEVKNSIPEFPGVEVRTQWWQNNQDEKSVSVFLYGRDSSTLLPIAQEVERRLKEIPELINIETDLQKTSNEIHIEIDRALAMKYGVDPTTIAGMVSYVVRGIDLPDYRTEEKEIDVRIQLRKEDRENLHQLKGFTVTTASGMEIPLSTFVKFRIEKGLGSINRVNSNIYLEVKSYTSEDNVEKVYEKIDNIMAGFDMPRGYKWDKGSRFRQFQEQDNAQQFAVILAITFVFILMGVLFESFILPLTVLVCIPFSFFGAFWLVFITGTTFGIMAMIGLIILIGVVVNNAIVLVDMINQFRKEGLSRHEAIVEASKNRFRPILMTAFTTIFGLIPMALGNSSLIGIPYAPLGRTIIGGLFTSTFFTLIFIPLAYTYFDDLRVTIKTVTVKIAEKFSSGGETQKV
ncbi:MAG: efflux RND transporter permease subunit [bacterium]|nr:efflux RND transporter permease subunit [bacterium]